MANCSKKKTRFAGSRDDGWRVSQAWTEKGERVPKESEAKNHMLPSVLGNPTAFMPSGNGSKEMSSHGTEEESHSPLLLRTKNRWH